MEFFAGLEADGLTRGDRDFSTGARVSTYASFSRLHGEDSESPQFDAVSLHERSFHAVEDGIDSCFGLGTRQSGAFDNPLYQVLLNHLSKDPSLWIP